MRSTYPQEHIGVRMWLWLNGLLNPILPLPTMLDQWPAARTG
ncbi:hypothetical protein [Nocardia sp. NPDC051570]